MTKGRFGIHGGQYIPETLMNAVLELEQAYEHYKNDKAFWDELRQLYRDYANRPSMLYYAEKMTKDLGGAKIYLKREDLNHTGAHKINNVLGQCLLAQRMGKKHVIAETGAGQHGVATATVAALMGMECTVYMGKEDCERQALNVFRMELLGAKVVPVTTGTGTLKDAVNEALRVWTARVEDTYYVLGSVMGPHPYPEMVRDFQKVIGEEVKAQLLEKEGRLPDAVIACVGGGSNAMGLFYDFIPDKDVRLIGVEAAGEGVDTERTAATKLSALRAVCPDYLGDSFETISAYGPGAALPHYVTPVKDSPELEAKGLYLCDSGGQYSCGTTDITRTVPLGPCTALEREDYTLVLKGHIDLAMAVFPEGTAGCQIDALARNPLWSRKRNFGHGTGHGVGFYLGVHEGPQDIRQNFNRQPLLPGMITSDEPGIYREGLFGVRHENLLLCVEAGRNDFGRWLAFEPLTLCHFDTSILVRELLTQEEIDWLNAYHERVYRTLAPELPTEVARWLREKTAAI